MQTPDAFETWLPAALQPPATAGLPLPPTTPDASLLPALPSLPDKPINPPASEPLAPPHARAQFQHLPVTLVEGPPQPPDEPASSARIPPSPRLDQAEQVSPALEEPAPRLEAAPE